MIARGMKIKTQLSLGFGFVLVCLVALGAIAWRQSNQIAERTTDLYEHPLMVSRALGELKADIFSMNSIMKDLVLARDEAERNRSLQRIETLRVDAQRQFAVLYDRYLGARSDIVAAEGDFTSLNSVRDETIRLIHDGKKEAALERVLPGGVGSEYSAILEGHIRRIDDFARNKADGLFRDAVALKETLNRQLIFLVSGLFAFTFLVAYTLFRNIRRPLAELGAATRGFMAGRRDSRCAYESRDEFGLLSASFNELAGTIETEMALSAKASALADIMLGEDDARLFCRGLLSSLLEHTRAQMGAVYLLNEEKTRYEHFESIGMDAARQTSFSASSFEGEFGQALASGKILHVVETVRDSRHIFKAASGEMPPRELFTIPLIVGAETPAIISLATVGRFDSDAPRLLDTILRTLSARMDGILSYRRLAAFSQRLEEQNKELETQKNELSAQARALTEQNIELETQKKQLAEASRLKTSFLSTMSHELRTPLNSVIALSGVLGRRLSGKVPAEEYGYLDVIERNGKLLLSLINDILDLSRIEAGREEIEIEKFDAKTLIREAVDLLEPLAAQKGIGLVFKDEGLLPEMLSDYVKCRHILQNVVGNAVKFTDSGGVEIGASASGGFMSIFVTDTGIGIEEKDRELIFDEFRQADDSASRKYGGTGLGLAIARKYAQMLGGDIDVESESGKGSRFTIRVPLRPAAWKTDRDSRESRADGALGDRNPSARRAMEAGASRAPGKARTTKGKTILLVEDSEAIVIQMRDMLRARGYAIMVARNGAEALESIERTIPDAMILDLMMPEVDGFETLRRIRERESTDRLPVIILTAKYVTKEELAFLKHNGVRQLIQKGDINKEGLLEAVERMLFPDEDGAEAPPSRESSD